MAELGVRVNGPVEQILTGLKSEGKTAILVALDGQVAGVLGISDPMRDTTPAMIQRLKAAGVKRVVMLTGDDHLTAQGIARQAGIDDVRTRLMPEDKLAAVRELRAQRHVVASVGDGINDAPALAAANIGIAMGAAGSDIAIGTADIALMSDDLLKIPEAVRYSKVTLRNIHQNVLIRTIFPGTDACTGWRNFPRNNPGACRAVEWQPTVCHPYIPAVLPVAFLQKPGRWQI